MSKDRNKQRTENYKRLRDAGFSVQDATRFKGSSPDKIETAIKNKRLPPINPVKQAVSYGRKKDEVSEKRIKKFQEFYDWWKTGSNKPYEEYKEIKGRIQYEKVEEGVTYKYKSNYTYTISYEVRIKGQPNELKYVTITSDTKRSKKFLKDWVVEVIFPKNEGLYNSKPLKSSIKIVGAYEK